MSDAPDGFNRRSLVCQSSFGEFSAVPDDTLDDGTGGGGSVFTGCRGSAGEALSDLLAAGLCVHSQTGTLPGPGAGPDPKLFRQIPGAELSGPGRTRARTVSF